MEKHIFIGGTGRSGSNILKYLLSSHPEAYGLPFESRYVLDPDGIVDFYESYGSWSAYTIDFKLRRLFSLLHAVGSIGQVDRIISRLHKLAKWDKRKFSISRYCDWELDKYIPGFNQRVSELEEKLQVIKYPSNWIGAESFQLNHESYFMNYIQKEKLRDIFSTFIQDNIKAVLTANSKRLYVDDSTFNILHAQTLLEFVPQAKFLHIYRNPKDVVASLRKQAWAPSDLKHAIAFYKGTMQRWLAVRKNLPKNAYLEIKFEDLISSPETALNLISEYTQEDFTNLSNDFDLSHSNTGRWETDFTEEEKIVLEELLKEELNLMAYN